MAIVPVYNLGYELEMQAFPEFSQLSCVTQVECWCNCVTESRLQKATLDMLNILELTCRPSYDSLEVTGTVTPAAAASESAHRAAQAGN